MWDLESLASQAQKQPMRFQTRLANGLEHWEFQALPQHSNTHAQLQCCLDAAGNDQDRLARFFASNALLYGANEESWQLLTQFISELPCLRTFYWVLCPIVCTGEEKDAGKIVHVLCGFSDNAQEYPYPCITSTQESKQAFKLALKLAAQQTQSTAQHFSIFTVFPELTIAGASLGLPLFLAFCAAQNYSSKITYATGKLAEDGRILEVGNIDRKKTLCKKQPLIIPAPNNCEDMHTSFAAASVQEALLLNNAKNIKEIREILLDIHSPHRFWANVSRYSVESLHYMQEEILKHSQENWFQENALNALYEKLCMWNETIGKEQKKDAILTEIICKKYPWDYIENNNEIPRKLVWYLAMRHVRQCNHRGNYENAIQIWKYSENFYTIIPGKTRYDEYIKGFSLVITAHHNRFDFYFDPTENLDNKFKEIISRDWQAANNDDIDSKALVDFYGTLGQHAAFCQQKAQALEFFEKSKKCNHLENVHDSIRTLMYTFFVEQDNNPCAEKATEIILELCKVNSIAEIFLTIEKHKENWYLLHAILRYVADMAQCSEVKQSSLNYEEVFNSLINSAQEKHPWQLIMYNFGRIFSQKKHYELAEKALLKSLYCTFYDGATPIIKTMALLPLYELWQMQKTPQNAEDLWYTIKNHITNDLYVKHFQAISECDTFDSAMQNFGRCLTKTFSFNYR